MHMDAERGLDALARARMRDRVLGSIRPRRATLADRAAVAFEVIAKPAPYALRVIAVAALCVATVAGAIINNRSDENVIGGGLCQVSTTMFNAIAKLGYDIVERHAHGYLIDR